MNKRSYLTKNKDKMWSDTLKWEMYGKSNESVFVKGKLTLRACKIKLFLHDACLKFRPLQISLE